MIILISNVKCTFDISFYVNEKRFCLYEAKPFSCSISIIEEFSLIEVLHLSSYELNNGCNNKHDCEKTKGDYKTYTRVDRVVTFRLDILFKLIHCYPSYFHLIIKERLSKIYIQTFLFLVWHIMSQFSHVFTL